MKYGLGWRKEAPDWRDGKFRLSVPAGVTIDEKVDYDLRQFPAMDFPSRDQKRTNACVGFAVARNVEYLMRSQGINDFVPSPAFIYWAARRVINEVNKDEGCMIRDAFKCLSKVGIARESDWPFIPANITRSPPVPVIKKAAEHVSLVYHSVPQKLDHILSCLKHRLPVVWGAMIFKSWEAPGVEMSGVIQMPHPNDRPVGGHSTILVGWQAEPRRFIFANSWGAEWGQGGFGTIPADYVLHPDLGSDFWSAFLMSKTAEEKARK